ncbi:uncharacterized protein N7483_010029 [Penicillium malachiteum]|uniref:uncharacterized protein n=1 Tax=Penicillium malachiteum TaxID=1324776 RepID=UPI0025493FB0|nr:uncharacterized protein N7483_010029 [Penicillium malachiteum]KAJ5712848.1 hypothetical protein N7483_010029 [Penicillium malachiteum]
MGSMRHALVRAVLGTILALDPVLATPSISQLFGRAASTTSTAADAVTTCNGRTEYCTRSYSNITFMGSHDSAFVGELPQQNQNINITAQLDMGIRFLQAQTHKSLLDDSVLELCHTSCLLEDAGTLEAYLVVIKNWLDENPDEVVTVLLTNGDSVGISTFGSTFSSSGIDSYTYVPPSEPLAIGDWPTLGDLISSGKRLVAFLDYGADTSTVDYILDEFAYYFETPYDVTDKTFSNCSIDRPAGASASGRMYLVNHYLDLDILGIDIPDRGAAGTTNAATGEGSLGAQATECEGIYDRAPNVMLADFVDKGAVIDAQNQINGFSS